MVPAFPIPRTDLPRPPAARPLAGSAHVWFDPAGMAQAPALATARPVLAGLPTDRPLVMGILNVTPDSFSDGGAWLGTDAAVAQAMAMVAQGADILDIGGESTRPGAADVPEDAEIARTQPVITALRAAGLRTPVSIDTRKASVARAAVAAGADMVNDVSALGHDPDMASTIAALGVPVCLMHAQGTPQTMQANPQYQDVLAEVFEHLAARMAVALDAGILPQRLIIDPGLGFGKTVAHNITLLQGLARFHALGAAVLLGASRKRFIGTLSGIEVADQRLAGSLAVALHAAAQGAQVIRVHDVAETVQALALWRALTTSQMETRA